MPKPTPNPRKKKLNSICTKLAMFLVSETYTDEGDLQNRLSRAIDEISAVADACEANDVAAQSATVATEEKKP